MTLTEVDHDAINPALAWLPPKMDTVEARLEMLAIGLQESEFKVRRQYGDGPARGFWQFERNGGVVGVMTHPASKAHAADICDHRGVPFTKLDVWNALESDDMLAAVFARLLLWTEPGPLPKVNQPDAGWSYYLRAWRPGKPHPEKWAANHRAARVHLGFP